MYKETFRYYEEYRATKKLCSTTASWWDNRCGIRIESLDAFSHALAQMKHSWQKFSPQTFVRENLSDRVCMKRILNALQFDA